jgi:S-DNA-T family DNA segregation ATPase FtsK/SpoIIIE
MKILGPTRFHRLNEAGALVFLFAGLFFCLSLISYHPQDPSWNSVSGALRARNLTGFAGSYTADLCLQVLGLSAFAIPVLLWMLAWRWVRSAEIQAPAIKVFGSGLLLLSICGGLSLLPTWHPWNGAFSAGGIIGVLAADSLITSLNLTGAALLTSICAAAERPATLGQLAYPTPASCSGSCPGSRPT